MEVCGLHFPRIFRSGKTLRTDREGRISGDVDLQTSSYLLGLKFTLETDHKLLVSLLSTKKLDQLPPRVLRYF